MPTIPAVSTTAPTDLMTFKVEVGGEALPGTYGVIAIDIQHEINRIPTARVILQDGDPAAQDFALSSGDILVPGAEIVILAGYHNDNEQVFGGVITKQRIEARRGGGSRLHIEAFDKAYRMALSRRSRRFDDVTDADVFDQVLGEYGLQSDVDASASIQHPEITQYQVSDWDFLVARAERIGMVCTVEAGTMKVVPPNAGPDAVLSVAYGTGVFDVDIEMDARTQVRSVKASAWDQANQEILSTDLDDVSAPAQGNLNGPALGDVTQVDYELRHTGALRQEELDAWSKAQMIRSRYARIRGTIRVQGTSAVRPNDLVEVGGLGDRFNGPAYVAAVRHMLANGDWETTLQVGASPQWHVERFDVSPLPASGLNPSIAGLQIGVVTELEADPVGEDRVRVRIPLISDADSGIWARLASLDAGEERGFVFRPEIGDEVVVGFLGDDLHEPVILGMLHSSAKPAPISGSNDNHEKGLVTRSGMRVVFNDDESSLTIETPNGNTVVLSDDAGEIKITDEAGSTVTMSSDGITLDSAKALILKAATDLTIEGLNVTVKASSSLGLEGSASSSLKSGGATEVKGSIVNIN